MAKSVSMKTDIETTIPAGVSSDTPEQLKLGNQLCFPLYACARKVISLYTPYFKPLGITYTQYLVFMVLWEEDGLTVSELCDRLLLDSGTVTPLLKKMESAGYLTRTRSREDERVVIVSLTEKGYALRDEVAKIPEKIGACVDLDPEEAKMLYGLLYKVIGGIESR